MDRITPHPAIASNGDLSQRAALGDVLAFEKLVRANWPRIYRMLVAMLGNAADAEDVTQETFVRAWQGLPAFRGESLIRGNERT